MQKVVWIYSINVNEGGAPFGYASNTVGRDAKKNQEKLKSALLPEIALDFISYDTDREEMPSADLIVFNDIDARYICDEIKEKGLSIPYQDIYVGNLAKAEDAIRLALKN